jgi:CheY-like chemotaxis protein
MMTSITGTILIVDDDVDFVDSLSTFLALNGFAVLSAHDGREGLRLAKMHQPDLIIMDIIMRERSEGLFTVQQVRQAPELREVPIFVVSSLYSTIEDFGIAPDRGWLSHDEFFPKPVNTTLILDKIRERLGAAQHMRQSVVKGNTQS